MHGSLAVAEIQQLIFEHLRPEDRATLANLARTCTTFRETALNALWYDLKLLAPLIQVMPGDLWRVKTVVQVPRGYSINVLTFIRELDESDWPRFDLYAQRIHRLGFFPPTQDPNTAHLIHVHETVFRAFSSYRPVHLLLPNLRAFSPRLWEPHMSQSIPYISAFLNPKLTHVSIYNANEPPNEFSGFLLSMARMCPNICSLEIYGIPESVHSMPMIGAALEKLICGLHHLQFLIFRTSLGRRSFNIIHHLGSLHRLQRCTVIKLPSSASTSQVRDLFTTEGERFSKLCIFEFMPPTVELATDVVESLQCSLKHLSVNIRRETLDTPTPPRSSLTRFTGAFLRHRCVTSLTKLDLSGRIEPEEGPDSIRNVFKSLFSLHALRVFICLFECTVDLDDEWFADAAIAWPCLESIELDNGISPEVTLAGLIPLLKHCPKLHKILISISAGAFDPELLQPRICSMKITWLSLGTSPISGPVGVFRCLAMMFPKLIEIMYDCSGEDKENWDMVARLLEESVQDGYGA